MLSKLIPPDPCGDKGTCLVKATCKLPNEMPWSRREKCPAVEKYQKRKDRIESIQAWLVGASFVTSVLLFLVWIVVTFGWGLWEQYKLIRNLF